MARLKAVNPEEATGKAKELLDVVKTKMGIVPNLMRTMANAPAVLNAYLGFSSALASASINGGLGELIAITVANQNGCDYCNSAHSFIGEKLGLDAEAIESARAGLSSEPKTSAVLTFAKEILEHKGEVSDNALSEIKAAGYSEAQVLEIVAHVALSIFTNYINNLSDTEIDFPKLTPINKK